MIFLMTQYNDGTMIQTISYQDYFKMFGKATVALSLALLIYSTLAEEPKCRLPALYSRHLKFDLNEN